MHRWRLMGWSFAAGLLLLPLIAMQISDDVNWAVPDFIFAMVILVSAGLMLEFSVRRYRGTGLSRAYVAGMVIMLFTCVFQVWVNAAVGIIGDGSSELNLLFYGVVLVVILGMAVTRVAPGGMTRVMILVATLQAALIVMALIQGWGEVIVLTLPLTVLWLASAACFRLAASSGSGGDRSA